MKLDVTIVTLSPLKSETIGVAGMSQAARAVRAASERIFFIGVPIFECNRLWPSQGLQLKRFLAWRLLSCSDTALGPNLFLVRSATAACRFCSTLCHEKHNPILGTGPPQSALLPGSELNISAIIGLEATSSACFIRAVVGERSLKGEVSDNRLDALYGPFGADLKDKTYSP